MAEGDGLEAPQSHCSMFLFTFTFTVTERIVFSVWWSIYSVVLHRHVSWVLIRSQFEMCIPLENKRNRTCNHDINILIPWSLRILLFSKGMRTSYFPHCSCKREIFPLSSVRFSKFSSAIILLYKVITWLFGKLAIKFPLCLGRFVKILGIDPWTFTSLPSAAGECNR